MKKLRLTSYFSLLTSNFQKGFTLVELLIYMGLLSMILAILTNVFISSLDLQLESRAYSSVTADGNYILAKLTSDIHRASSISIPNSLGDTQDNFEIVVDGIDYTYSIDGNENLVLTNDLGANALNSYDSSVIFFSVKRIGNAGKEEDNLRINFTLSSKTLKKSGQYEVKDFQTDVGLRRQ